MKLVLCHLVRSLVSLCHLALDLIWVAQHLHPDLTYQLLIFLIFLIILILLNDLRLRQCLVVFDLFATVVVIWVLVKAFVMVIHLSFRCSPRLLYSLSLLDDLDMVSILIGPELDQMVCFLRFRRRYLCHFHPFP